jgi:hypothetical protein
MALTNLDKDNLNRLFEMITPTKKFVSFFFLVGVILEIKIILLM